MSDEELIEKAAKAAYEGAFLKHAPEEVDRWEDLVADNEPATESWREVARRALAVFREHTASLGLTEPSLVASDRVTTSEPHIGPINSQSYGTREHTAPTDDERAVIRQVREFVTKERDSIRGRYGAGASAYAGYANACDDILDILAGHEKEGGTA